MGSPSFRVRRGIRTSRDRDGFLDTLRTTGNRGVGGTIDECCRATTGPEAARNGIGRTLCIPAAAAGCPRPRSQCAGEGSVVGDGRGNTHDAPGFRMRRGIGASAPQGCTESFDQFQLAPVEQTVLSSPVHGRGAGGSFPDSSVSGPEPRGCTGGWGVVGGRPPARLAFAAPPGPKGTGLRRRSPVNGAPPPTIAAPTGRSRLQPGSSLQPDPFRAGRPLVGARPPQTEPG